MKFIGSVLCAIFIAMGFSDVSKAEEIKPKIESGKKDPTSIQEAVPENIGKTQDGFTAGLWLTEDKALIERGPNPAPWLKSPLCAG